MAQTKETAKMQRRNPGLVESLRMIPPLRKENTLGLWPSFDFVYCILRCLGFLFGEYSRSRSIQYRYQQRSQAFFKFKATTGRDHQINWSELSKLITPRVMNTFLNKSNKRALGYQMEIYLFFPWEKTITTIFKAY